MTESIDDRDMRRLQVFTDAFNEELIRHGAVREVQRFNLDGTTLALDKFADVDLIRSVAIAAWTASWREDGADPRPEHLTWDGMESEEPYKIVAHVRLFGGKSRTFLVNRHKSVDRVWKALIRPYRKGSAK
ncbi:hypothetical protein ACFVAJ_18395 [Agromyces sp. NPDC057679]|uniref:hypothetical protein n=1 Tax=Agromyces sp. NPDC057679 TaxID=3346207 RepID=UPI0036717EBF